MIISSLWYVKEPTHYSIRVGDVVPGVVAVLFSPAEVAGLKTLSVGPAGVELTTSRVTARCSNQVKCWLLKWGEYRSTRRTNKLNPYITPSLGIEPGPHWWPVLSPLRHPCTPNNCITKASFSLVGIITRGQFNKRVARVVFTRVNDACKVQLGIHTCSPGHHTIVTWIRLYTTCVSSNCTRFICWPSAANKYSNALTERRHFSRNSREFSISSNRLSSKFLGCRITRCLDSFSSSSSLNENISKFRKTLPTSRTLSLQETYDWSFALVINKLDVCKDTSRTPVKLLLNCARTKFYRCCPTPVN